MTERTWRESSDVVAMLRHLECGPRSPEKVSDRKLRLFACACSRQIWPLMTNERSRTAVEVAEQYADGGVMNERLRAARVAAWVAAWATAEDAAGAAARVAAWVAARVVQARLLRDIIGNPFRSVMLERMWLGCDRCDGVALDDHGCPCRYSLLRQVAPIARAAYDDRLADGTLDPVRLTILADALEETGCTTEELLGHLRSPSPHVRGCWGLDFVLGKE